MVVVIEEPRFSLLRHALDTPLAIYQSVLKTSEGIREHGTHQGCLGTFCAGVSLLGKELFGKHVGIGQPLRRAVPVGGSPG